MDKTEEAKINGLSCFIEKGALKKALRNEVHVFYGENTVGDVSIVSFRKEESLTRAQINDIISSIRYQDKPGKSAAEYFEEGVSLLNRKEFEKAKFCFASALCLDWENPQYHYGLGWAYALSKSGGYAQKHLEKAISLKPDYPEAQKLLEEIKAKAENVKKPS